MEMLIAVLLTATALVAAIPIALLLWVVVQLAF